MFYRAIACVLVVGGVGLAQSQPTAAPPTTVQKFGSAGAGTSWVFNFDSSPLLIRSEGESTYVLLNTSGKNTRRYRLGCVRVVNSHVKITHLFRELDSKIASREEEDVYGFARNWDRSECEARHSRLAVMDVEFEDGTTWTPLAGHSRRVR